MGSGISLDKDKLVQIIERDLHANLNEYHAARPRYTQDGVEIFYGFDDEEELNSILQEINMFRRREKRLNER
jgi:hypothetical protein